MTHRTIVPGVACVRSQFEDLHAATITVLLSRKMTKEQHERCVDQVADAVRQVLAQWEVI